VNILQVMVTISGFLNLYLAARSSIWNWLFGIITALIYLYIFSQVRLYANMSLQLVFLILQFIGLYSWQKSTDEHAERPVTPTPHYAFKVIALALPVLFVSLVLILKFYTDSTLIMIDAFITALSLVAQWMFNMKWIENWLLWMIAMLLSALMCAMKQLYLVSFVYLAFFAIDIYGYQEWKKAKPSLSLAI